MNHQTGYTTVIWGNETWHRTPKGAMKRMASHHYMNSGGEQEGVIWCRVTGYNYDKCSCSQCKDFHRIEKQKYFSHESAIGEFLEK